MKINSLLLAFVSIVLAGCATSGAAPVLVSDTPPNRVYWDNVQGDGYRVKVSRDVGRMGSLCMTEVFMDGRLAAEIGQGESVVFKVAPGSHVLKAAPSLKSSQCKTFYSNPQFQVEATVVGIAGDLKDYRYGFSRGGLPVLSPSSP